MNAIKAFFSKNTTPFLVGGAVGFIVTKWDLLSLALSAI